MSFQVYREMIENLNRFSCFHKTLQYIYACPSSDLLPQNQVFNFVNPFQSYAMNKPFLSNFGITLASSIYVILQGLLTWSWSMTYPSCVFINYHLWWHLFSLMRSFSLSLMRSFCLTCEEFLLLFIYLLIHKYGSYSTGIHFKGSIWNEKIQGPFY